ncbi:hypothetical protein [Streptomyces capitiformicae]|uniref:Uncharacterized protein n=1 Tax=Streptomyces capitiformicae TaxID=2014920 RepID=A0A919DN71_9ACTN|nr:hypothetical protein [Streptomyces capitiformicae]GHE59163.1 hypothetical protein GCM10017771_82310 [Streptomyces capitiformicae]
MGGLAVLPGLAPHQRIDRAPPAAKGRTGQSFGPGPGAASAIDHAEPEESDRWVVIGGGDGVPTLRPAPHDQQIGAGREVLDDGTREAGGL